MRKTPVTIYSTFGSEDEMDFKRIIRDVGSKAAAPQREVTCKCYPYFGETIYPLPVIEIRISMSRTPMHIPWPGTPHFCVHDNSPPLPFDTQALM